jgi:uncharacterized membrane-anchored protein YhcB (DUF1043 family)
MKQMIKEWIYLTITIVMGSVIGIILGVLRETIGKF